MTTDDIERIVKLHQSITDRGIQAMLEKLLAIEVERRGIEVVPRVSLKENT